MRAAAGERLAEEDDVGAHAVVLAGELRPVWQSPVWICDESSSQMGSTLCAQSAWTCARYPRIRDDDAA